MATKFFEGVIENVHLLSNETKDNDWSDIFSSITLAYWQISKRSKSFGNGILKQAFDFTIQFFSGFIDNEIY